MGEFSASDYSWNKMVLSKSADQWTSTIKSEHNDDFAGTSGDFAEEGHERGMHEDFGNVEAETIVQELDPLLVDSKERRRRGSGLKSETPEMRASRLAKMSAYAAQRLANETPEQRAARLKRMSDYAAKRLARETSEQRAKRLARMSQYAAKRLAAETPEQRRVRLARMSEYAAKRQALRKKVATTEKFTQIMFPDQS